MQTDQLTNTGLWSKADFSISRGSDGDKFARLTLEVASLEIWTFSWFFTITTSCFVDIISFCFSRFFIHTRLLSDSLWEFFASNVSFSSSLNKLFEEMLWALSKDTFSWFFALASEKHSDFDLPYESYYSNWW